VKGDRVIIYLPCRSKRGRHAGLRAHWRHPLGGVRRLLSTALRDRIEDAGAVLSSPPTSSAAAARASR